MHRAIFFHTTLLHLHLKMDTVSRHLKMDTVFQEHLVTEKKTHHQQSINQLKVKKKCKSDNEVERHLICRHKQQQPYTQLVHLKFELTNQDSTGSQASLLTGDGNEYSQKGIYYSTNLVSETLNKNP